MTRKSNKAAAPTIGAELAATVQEASVAAPAAPAPVVAVALRGGPAVKAIKLGDKPYRVTAKHNVDWWIAITGALAANNGNPVAVADLQKTVGCPLTHFGYLLRRGHLAAHSE
jgi:hypothetical protein